MRVIYWRWPGWVYLTYRLVLAFYLLFWLGYTSGNFHGGKRGSGWTWGAALTNWTYALLAVYATWHLIATIIHYTQVTVNPPESSSESSSCWRRPSEDFHNALFTDLNEGLYERVTEEAGGRGTSTTSARDRLETSRPAWYLCVVWILYSAVSSFAVIVTVVYFAVLHDWTEVIDISNLQVHAFNSLLVFLEHSVSAIPYRLLHVVYPLLYGLLYLLFSLYYWTTDHRKVVQLATGSPVQPTDQSLPKPCNAAGCVCRGTLARQQAAEYGNMQTGSRTAAPYAVTVRVVFHVIRTQDIVTSVKQVSNLHCVSKAPYYYYYYYYYSSSSYYYCYYYYCYYCYNYYYYYYYYCYYYYYYYCYYCYYYYYYYYYYCYYCYYYCYYYYYYYYCYYCYYYYYYYNYYYYYYYYYYYCYYYYYYYYCYYCCCYYYYYYYYYYHYYYYYWDV
nr:hypothetical protein BaRGS_020995 [Batillaria attramentaria]